MLRELIKAIYAIANAIKGESGRGDSAKDNLTWYDFLSTQTDKVPVFAGNERIVNLKELSISENLPNGPWLYFEKSYDAWDVPRFTTYEYHNQDNNQIIAFYGGNNVEYEQEINGKTYYYYQTD